MIDTDKLQPFYDNYLRAAENWGQVSKPGLDAFMAGDSDAIEADQEAVLQARAECYFAANELAECLRDEVARAAKGE
jgi:hypothetical protein